MTEVFVTSSGDIMTEYCVTYYEDILTGFCFFTWRYDRGFRYLIMEI